MQVSCISFCTGSKLLTKEDWQSFLMQEIQSQIDSGSEIILYPELFFLDLYQYFSGNHQERLASISKHVLEVVMPMVSKLKYKGVICLGTFPRVSGNQIFNSAPVLVNEQWHFQDKIHLTPWEVDFTPGNDLKLFQFRDLKFSVLICYDVEHPHLVHELKKQGIHFMLVPSATADTYGSERVLRCSSGRSIELGAAVLAVPLIGKSTCDLIDWSEGRQGYFLPSQSDVKGELQSYSKYTSDEHQVLKYNLDNELLLKLKSKTDETKPFLEPQKTFSFKIV